MYKYEEQKQHIFSEDMQETFLKIRDNVHKLLKSSGAVTMGNAIAGATGGDSWKLMACVDRLVELKEIKEVERKSWGQFRIFVPYYEE